MVTRRHLLAAAALTLTAGCTGGAGEDDTDSGGEITGTVTVLTNRTDLVDTRLAAYATKFQTRYPGTKVTFEGVTNYEGDVTTQLSSGDYGDVLLIPNTVAVDQLAQFFAPLGTVDELRGKYRFVTDKAYENQVYGLSPAGVAGGLVVNQRVWARAGITAPPTTPDEFLAGLRAIKATGAVPYYTNYKDGWPLSMWNSQRALLGDPQANETFPADPAPWQPGKIAYLTDGLLFDIVRAGLSEKDPLTTNWEASKPMLGTGKAAAMLLGSWAVPQMQDAAKAAGADPADIAFWPFPYQAGGKFHARMEPDYTAAVSRTSENKATARAWLDFFLTESGFATDEQAIPPALDQPLPPLLQKLTDSGVELIEVPPATTNAGKEDEIIRDSEIDLKGNIYRQKLVDIARGAAKGDKESYFAELNERWGEAQARVMK